MSDPYFQKLFAERIGGANYGKGTAIYKFEKIKRAKRKALAEHPERKLIDFGIGENDEMAPQPVRARAGRGNQQARESRLCRQRARRVQGGRGAVHAPQLRRRARCRPREVNHCIGSKTALAMLPAAFINPGDVTLMTVPGYPVAGTHTKYYGGRVYTLPLLAENDFLPDLESIPADVCAQAKLLVLCYPNSPTGKVATRDFYKRVVDFARQNDIVVVQDAAHIMLTFEGEPLSFLSVPGAKDVGVEVHSMSKGFHMIGWRLGWVCGHERIVQAFADVKDNSDSGQFMAIQKAAAAALDDRRDSAGRAGQVRATAAASWSTCSTAAASLPDAGRHVLHLRQESAGHRRRADLRNGRSGQPVPDHRAFDLHRALGRRRRVLAVFGHLRSRRRSRAKTR